MKSNTNFQSARVIPVITLNRVEDAVPLAEALLAGGVNVLEVTVRTPVAFEAMRKIAHALPDAVVGAGTLLKPEQFDEAVDAGASFCVSPGLTERLAHAAERVGLPYLPGVATASEVIQAQEWGFDMLKFFPAEVSGGVPFLQAVRPLFPDVSFCPTGGVGLENMKNYLALPNVMCVGMSIIAPQKLIDAKDWTAITELAKKISKIAKE